MNAYSTAPVAPQTVSHGVAWPHLADSPDHALRLVVALSKTNNNQRKTFDAR